MTAPPITTLTTALGISQRQLAHLLGVTPRSVQRWYQQEAGGASQSHTPTPALQVLVRLLGCPEAAALMRAWARSEDVPPEKSDDPSIFS